MEHSDTFQRLAANVEGHKPQRIVILRALQLGDLLCAVPAFRALRTAFPHSEIVLLGLPWARSLVERFQHYLDGFREFPGWPGLPERAPAIEQIPAFFLRPASGAV